MYKIKNNFLMLLTLALVLFTSCQDLDEVNINPNGVDPSTADLNLLLPTIETGIGAAVVDLGFGDLAGVMQHTQKDGWSGGHNDYAWGGQSWSGYYGILRNNKEFYEKAVDRGFVFHQGISLVMKSFTFGLITDLWGDAPYTEALQGDEGPEHFKPVYDDQQVIYMGILADLETANTLLSQDQGSYLNIDPDQDILYHGDVAKWRKFANSLALRYYMRISVKDPSTAAAGIGKITANPAAYPLILDSSDNANIDFVGTSPSDSWPSNLVFDPSPDNGDYMRLKMCSTLVEVLQGLNDPRLGVYANKVETPLVLVPNASGLDEIRDGNRYVSQDIVDALYTKEELLFAVPDYDPEYVGLTPSFIAGPIYNMQPDIAQAVFNPHASQLNDIFKESTGDLLKMRVMSAAEVHFILAESALNGWGPGSPEGHYASGIQESMKSWGIGDEAGDYIAGAPYSGLESIIMQKWIASWTAAAESWFDYRRTGIPDLQTGTLARREALPLRFYYNFGDETSLNRENAAAAIEKLQPTEFIGTDQTNNSAWSKSWLLQGTGKPY
jgi:hypothetical protein